MTEQDLNNLTQELHGVFSHVTSAGTIFVIVPRHKKRVEVYVNPDKYCGCEKRYGFMCEDLAKKAILDYETTNILQYWSDDKKTGNYVKANNLYSCAYSSEANGVIESFECGVSWNIDDLESAYL
jgi:hypothetical protein